MGEVRGMCLNGGSICEGMGERVEMQHKWVRGINSEQENEKEGAAQQASAVL